MTVEDSGKIFLNRDAVSLAELPVGVRELMNEPQESVIVINADEAVSHGGVIAVMDQLRDIEGVIIGIATEPPKQL